MTTTMFKEVNPVLAVRDVEKAVRFYVERLGFRVAFGSGNYVGVRRDGVELHLQWHDEADFQAGPGPSNMLRFVVEDPDALFEEYKGKEVLQGAVRETEWGTREFAVWDLDGHGLTFYRDR